ncbi:MAG: hypothetical protein ACI9FD_002170, partial [Gammaproteobacteria bacterium]
FDGNRHLDHAATHTRCTMGEALIEGSAGTLELKGDGSVLVRNLAICNTRHFCRLTNLINLVETVFIIFSSMWLTMCLRINH